MMYDDWCKKKRVLQEREEKQIQEYLGDNLFYKRKIYIIKLIKVKVLKLIYLTLL